MIDELLSYANKLGVEAEVYYSKSSKTTASFENNKVKIFEDTVEDGLGIRVKVNGKIGFASTNNINNLNPKRLLETAISLSKINVDNQFLGFPETSVKDDGSYYSNKIAETPSAMILDYSGELLNLSVKELGKIGIDCVVSGGVAKTIVEIKICNTSGVYSEYKKTFMGKTIYGKAVNTPSLECQVTDISIISEGREIEKIADEFKEKLKRSLNPRETSQIKKKLVFNPAALGELLYFTLGQAISGENIHRQRSFLVDKINQKIASNKLTLIDWGNSNNFVSGRPFDCEGVSTGKNTLIDKGVLKNAIYDIEWGERSGNGSTGNAHRGYATPPTIRLNTIHILPSTSHNILKDVSDGYYISNISGAHTSNSTTGDFGIVLTGAYEIRRGELSTPIYGPILSASCQKLLSSIVDVGSDEEHIAINGTAVRFGPVSVEL